LLAQMLTNPPPSMLARRCSPLLWQDLSPESLGTRASFRPWPLSAVVDGLVPLRRTVVKLRTRRSGSRDLSARIERRDQFVCGRHASPGALVHAARASGLAK